MSIIPEELEPMPDVIDQGCRNEQRITDSAINEIRNVPFDEGKAGRCEECGIKKSRVIVTRRGLLCGGCRDDLRIE